MKHYVSGVGLGEGLRVRWSAARREFFVENLFEFDCGSAKEAMKHYVSGVRQKRMASTSMNVASSRSHAVFQLTLERRPLAAAVSSSSEDPQAGSASSSS